MEMKTGAQDNKLEAALEYIDRGWAVFPLAPKSKTPLKGSKGFKDASKDAAVVRSWWKTNPAANIGIATGKISGLFVVDLDDGAEGIASWGEVCRQQGQPQVETLTARTVSEGRHLLFTYPPGDVSLNCSTKVFPHIDTRANGGYIVAPPSYAITPKCRGFYSWLNPGAPIAEMPAWLISAYQGIVAPVAQSIASPIAAHPQARIQQGSRHDSIKRTIRGYAESSIYFIHLWRRAFGLVYKSTAPAAEDLFTVGELFRLCLWAWNEAKQHDQLSHPAAWKMLEGRARGKGDIAFGALGAGIHTLFIPTTQQPNSTNISTSQ